MCNPMIIKYIEFQKNAGDESKSKILVNIIFMSQITSTLGKMKGKTKYYPKLGTLISCQFSEAELSWELNRGEFSEFRGLDWA